MEKPGSTVCAASNPRASSPAAIISTIFAVPAGLQPGRDSIALEGTDSPYVNVIVVRTAEKDRPEFAKLVAAYRSPEVKKYLLDTFKGAVLPSC